MLSSQWCEAHRKWSIVMEGNNLVTDSSSVILIPSYDSDLSAGLDVARYYLSKSIKDSTKQQVWYFPITSMGVMLIILVYAFWLCSTIVFTVSGVPSAKIIMCLNLEPTIGSWLHVFPL